MRTLSRDAAHVLWNQWWAEMNHSWFKLEVLPSYDGEDHVPSYFLWMEGRYEQSIAALSSPDVKWGQQCQAKVARGVQLQRIRIVGEPNPFIQWELHHYQQVNIPAGEEVLIIDRSQVTNWPLPSGDVMIFDGLRAAQLAYDNTGRMTHGMFYEGPEDRTRLIELLRLQQSLLGIAQPLTFS